MPRNLISSLFEEKGPIERTELNSPKMTVLRTVAGEPKLSTKLVSVTNKRERNVVSSYVKHGQHVRNKSSLPQ
jgi:hypothetical protein